MNPIDTATAHIVGYIVLCGVFLVSVIKYVTYNKYKWVTLTSAMLDGLTVFLIIAFGFLGIYLATL